MQKENIHLKTEPEDAFEPLKSLSDESNYTVYAEDERSIFLYSSYDRPKATIRLVDFSSDVQKKHQLSHASQVPIHVSKPEEVKMLTIYYSNLVDIFVSLFLYIFIDISFQVEPGRSPGIEKCLSSPGIYNKYGNHLYR